jgi:hypothetical protein
MFIWKQYFSKCHGYIKVDGVLIYFADYIETKSICVDVT